MDETSGGCSPGVPATIVTGVVGLLQLSNESHKVMAGLVTAAWLGDRNMLPSVEDKYNFQEKLYSIKHMTHPLLSVRSLLPGCGVWLVIQTMWVVQ